jgi:hypothetical protein
LRILNRLLKNKRIHRTKRGKNSMDSKRVIETGVDQLVQIVKQHARVSVEDAAKELGYDKDIIMEWALFLEEEGIINVEYKLTNTFLVSRTLTKKEIVLKQKEISDKKDVVLRKANMLRSMIEKENQGFEELNKEFVSLREEVSKEAEILQKDIADYERLKTLKEEMDSKIIQTRTQMQTAADNLKISLSQDKIEYTKVLYQMRSDEQALKKLVENSSHVVFTEHALKNQMQAIRQALKKLETQLNSEDAKIHETRKNIIDSRKKLLSLKQNIAEKQHKVIKELESKRKTMQKDVEKSAKMMLSKLAAIKSDETRFEDKLKRHEKAYMMLKEKQRLQKMMENIRADNVSLNKEVDELIAKIMLAKVSSIGEIKFDENQIREETQKVSKHIDTFHDKVTNFMGFGSLLKKDKKTETKKDTAKETGKTPKKNTNTTAKKYTQKATAKAAKKRL